MSSHLVSLTGDRPRPGPPNADAAARCVQTQPFGTQRLRSWTVSAGPGYGALGGGIVEPGAYRQGGTDSGGMPWRRCCSSRPTHMQAFRRSCGASISIVGSTICCPSFEKDNEIYPTAIFLIGTKSRATQLPEVAEAHTNGYHGLHDAKLRLADMDREGVAAELIYHGDFRLGDMFHNNTNDKFSLDAWHAGSIAWNRWAGDNFSSARDRFLAVGTIGPCIDMDATVAELQWIADHGFVGTYAPGYMTHPDLPPLFDEYWEPFWSTCEELGLALVVHAGFGWEQGAAFPHLKRIYTQAAEAAGSTDRESLLAHADAVGPEGLEFFHEFSSSPRPRRAMWQLMLNGIFDRHSGLKLLLTEVRADWIPATLHHLDKVYEENRTDLPALKRPSEYWHSNCLAGASFIHKAEVAMRHEIGVDTIAFGRDYPHPEGTWPNTKDWLRDAFGGVPEDEIRLMLGENAVRFLRPGSESARGRRRQDRAAHCPDRR